MAGMNGLAMQQVTSCFEGRTHKVEVGAMQAETIERGITSTPTRTINGMILRYTGTYEDRDRRGAGRSLSACPAVDRAMPRNAMPVSLP